MADEKRLPDASNLPPEQRHESKDVDEGAILAVGGIIAATIVFVGLGVFLLTHLFGVHQEHIPPPYVHPEPGTSMAVPPLMQTMPGEYGASVDAAKEQVLNGYGWADRQAGIVHIPIERAMKLMGERREQKEQQKQGEADQR